MFKLIFLNTILLEKYPAKKICLCPKPTYCELCEAAVQKEDSESEKKQRLL
jgi:hypothetical protein